MASAEVRKNKIMPHPLVTIAIPCFNAQNTIERAIKSAQNQDWLNTEILVVDDGSEDGSGALIEALAKKDKRIRLIAHEANQGVAVARNILLEKARGEFIAFFDADDVSYPERIRLQYQRLIRYEQESRADLILCYSGIKSIPLANGGSSSELRGIGYCSPEPVGWEYVGHYFPVRNDMKKCAWGLTGSGTLFMRRAVFDRIGLFDSELYRSEDTDYAIRAGLKGAHFISVNQALLDWYINEADYKTDQKLLHYHHLMYQKYKYLFPNKFRHWCAWQRAKVSLCHYIATRKNEHPSMTWYFGWGFFWLFVISPQTFLKRGWAKGKNFFRNRRPNRAEIVGQKASK